MKVLSATVLMFALCAGAYSQSREQAKRLPLPKVTYRHAKSRHKQLKAEVLNKIINPLLCECKVPIEEIIVDFCPEIIGPKDGERGCQNEAQGELTINVIVNRTDGASSFVFFDVNKEGSFDKYDYLKIFAGDNRVCIPDKDCASTDKPKM